MHIMLTLNNLYCENKIDFMQANKNTISSSLLFTAQKIGNNKYSSVND